MAEYEIAPKIPRIKRRVSKIVITVIIIIISSSAFLLVYWKDINMSFLKRRSQRLYNELMAETITGGDCEKREKIAVELEDAATPLLDMCNKCEEAFKYIHSAKMMKCQNVFAESASIIDWLKHQEVQAPDNLYIKYELGYAYLDIRNYEESFRYLNYICKKSDCLCNKTLIACTVGILYYIKKDKAMAKSYLPKCEFNKPDFDCGKKNLQK
jgi:hypothetical protein